MKSSIALVLLLLGNTVIEAASWEVNWDRCYLESEKEENKKTYVKEKVIISQNRSKWTIKHLNADPSLYPLSLLKSEDGIMTFLQPKIGPGHRSYTVYLDSRRVVYTEIAWGLIESKILAAICFGTFK